LIVRRGGKTGAARPMIPAVGRCSTNLIPVASVSVRRRFLPRPLQLLGWGRGAILVGGGHPTSVRAQGHHALMPGGPHPPSSAPSGLSSIANPNSRCHPGGRASPGSGGAHALGPALLGCAGSPHPARCSRARARWRAAERSAAWPSRHCCYTRSRGPTARQGCQEGGDYRDPASAGRRHLARDGVDDVSARRHKWWPGSQGLPA
jgi:hypothetical protein